MVTLLRDLVALVRIVIINLSEMGSHCMFEQINIIYS